MSTSSVQNLLQTIRRWFHRRPDPEAPYPGVRVPLHRGPAGRGSAIALEEPPGLEVTAGRF